MNVQLTGETSFESSESFFFGGSILVRTAFDFLENTSANTSKTQQKKTGRKYTEGLLFWVKHTLKPMKMYLLSKSLIFHCQKQMFILEADGFPFRSPTCQMATDEKIPRVIEPLNPSTTKPRKNTNHKHNFSSPAFCLLFSMVSFPIHLCFFGGFTLRVFLKQSYISRRVPTTSNVQPLLSSSAQSLSAAKLRLAPKLWKTRDFFQKVSIHSAKRWDFFGCPNFSEKHQGCITSHPKNCT